MPGIGVGGIVGGCRPRRAIFCHHRGVARQGIADGRLREGGIEHQAPRAREVGREIQFETCSLGILRVVVRALHQIGRAADQPMQRVDAVRECAFEYRRILLLGMVVAE